MHLLPVRATVLRAVYGAWLVPGIEHIGIVGMTGQGPHVLPITRCLQSFPVFPAIVTAVDPDLGASIQHRGIVRVDQ
jgi:hypothetical protein